MAIAGHHRIRTLERGESTNSQRLVLGTILAAIVGYFIVVPIYEILSSTVQLDPLVMLGIGIILAVILVKSFGKIGSFVTLGMLVVLGLALIIVGFALSSQAVSWSEVSDDSDFDDATNYAYQRNMVKLSNNTLVCFHMDGTGKNRSRLVERIDMTGMG